eukprot:4558413-Pyramimonas_sp.AAC.1
MAPISPASMPFGWHGLPIGVGQPLIGIGDLGRPRPNLSNARPSWEGTSPISPVSCPSCSPPCGRPNGIGAVGGWGGSAW